jgi:putative spermidine/putrescine transport system substrate-binding protein
MGLRLTPCGNAVFDPVLRPLKDRTLDPLARAISRTHPTAITALALLTGLGAAGAAWRGAYWIGLALWLGNRLFDGLDGAVARAQNRSSDLGGYLDIMADFVVYAAIPVAIALGPGSSPELVRAAVLLLAVFYVNTAGWMMASALLEKRGHGAGPRGEATSVSIPEGIISGGETILFYGLFFVLPNYQVTLFLIMAALTALTVVQRVIWGIRIFGSRSVPPTGVWLLAIAVLAQAACGPPDQGGGPTASELALQPWDSVEARARGTEVTWRMWRGDPAINAYIDGWVATALRERYGIRLTAVQGQGPELINQLVVEREAGARGGADLVWINGETFHNLQAERLLQGPWAGALPSAAWVDSASAIVMSDFEQDLEGYESPWGRVQFALIYDSLRTPNPPQTVEELGRWIDANPGRFTHDQSFTGMTFLKVLMYTLGGGVEEFQGGFREDAYARGSEQVMAWLNRHSPAFWRDGTVYPSDVADLHRLFANGEVDFSMSNNQNEAVTKVEQDVFPPTARPLVLRNGTIANAHYVGIPFNAPNPAGAMVVANFLLSPEAQLEKQRSEVWGDGTVLAPDRMPPEWRARFDALEADPRSVPTDTLRRYALPEVAPEYHERLTETWRQRIRRSGG